MFFKPITSLSVGSTVLVRVTKLYPDKVECDIISIDGYPSRSKYKGVISLSDIFTKNILLEDVKTIECFMPGDIVKALVLSVVDRQQIVLSTSGPNYGVVNAYSKAGYKLKAVSWRHMQCTGTNKIEMRKTAKLNKDKTIKMR